MLSSVTTAQQPNIFATLNIAKAFLAANLLVVRPPGPLQFASTGQTYCFEYKIPDAMATKNYDADIVFFVSVESGGYLASAGPCAFDSSNSRPLFGLIGFGTAFPLIGAIDAIQSEKNVETVLHEIIHGLGFLKSMFPWFYDSARNKYYNQSSQLRNGVVYLQTPRLVDLTQYYFSCSTATGLPMENEGGSGTADSHWERALFNNEVMTGSDLSGDFIFSIFTFTALVDSGWYRLGNIQPDVMEFGQFRGCSFFNKQCGGGTFKEFCNQGDTPTCSYGNTGYGTCSRDPLGNGCSFVRIYSDFDCRDVADQSKSLTVQGQRLAANMMTFNYNSMCVVGSMANDTGYKYPVSCHTFTCSSNNKVLMLKLDGPKGYTQTCKDGLTFTNKALYGSITCPPNIWHQCYTYNECPGQCNQKGYCVKQICYCKQGYYGVGCQSACSTYRYGLQCLKTCPTGTFNEDSTMQCLGCPYGCQTCTTIGSCSLCKSGFNMKYGFCERDFTVPTAEETILKAMRTGPNSAVTEDETSPIPTEISAQIIPTIVVALMIFMSY